MGKLLAIEGLDGAGKNTLATGLNHHLKLQGKTSTTLTFPRYADSFAAQLAHAALHNQAGDTITSSYAMAGLFALDRAAAKELILDHLRNYDYLIIDRYIASNLAYTLARLDEDLTGPASQWISHWEIEKIGLPLPDLQIFLDVSTETAEAQALSRAAISPDRTPDHYEQNHTLQQKVKQNYHNLASHSWGSPWLIKDPNQTIAAFAEVLEKTFSALPDTLR